jgi:hypothetical protein
VRAETVEGMLFAAENRAPDPELAQLRWEAVENAAGSSRACPECARGMERFSCSRSRIVIDRCLEHGVWLDLGELQTIHSTLEGKLPAGPGTRPGPPGWTCPSCGELIEFQFTRCWKCMESATPGASRPILTPASEATAPAGTGSSYDSSEEGLFLAVDVLFLLLRIFR